MNAVYARTAHTCVVENGFVVEHSAAQRRGMTVIMPEMVVCYEYSLELWFPDDDSPHTVTYRTTEDAAKMAAQWQAAGVKVVRHD